jgi:iron complex outermembrane receptor protein
VLAFRPRAFLHHREKVVRKPATHFAWSIAAVSLLLFCHSAGAQVPDLADLSIEELSQIEVTLVSRQPERVADAPASIYVITREDIRRAGFTNLAEALRLAPNLQVARIDSVQYAISARGFNNAVGNKLLVMIDGRTVYTPLFSGVFWDQQDVLLPDVERIEIISGPGATLWGANAVNGVINVITRSAAETQGTRVSARVGGTEREATARYGDALGANGHFRVYGKMIELDNTKPATGLDVTDEWQRAQIGFRADWDFGRDSYTLQSDAYDGESADRGSFFGFAFGRIETSGANVLGRWTRRLDDGASLQVQTYFDHAERDDFLFFRPKADIFDAEVQHSFSVAAHKLVWGGGYRHSSDDIATGFTTTFIPRSRDLNWQNLFAQDQIALSDDLEVTVGLKLEKNPFTGTESLPNVRVAWKPDDRRLVWAGVSRAVRAPSRYDRDVFFPGTPPFLVLGGPNFVSEVANVLEAGYRAEPTASFAYSVTAYYHDWDKLRSGTALPVQLVNQIEGPAQGVEAWATWRVAAKWQLSAGMSALDKDLELKPGSTDPVGVDNETLANDADYQWQLRAMADLPHDITLDVRTRHVEELPNPAVPSYTAVDVSLGWRPQQRLTLQLMVRNLFDDRHPEYGPFPSRSELERTALIEAALTFGE